MGTYAATTVQNYPGAAILYQDLILPSANSYTIFFILYYRNNVGSFCTPNSYSSGICNQQYRVDIMNPAAPVDSVAAGDVLLLDQCFRRNDRAVALCGGRDRIPWDAGSSRRRESVLPVKWGARHPCPSPAFCSGSPTQTASVASGSAAIRSSSVPFDWERCRVLGHASLDGHIREVIG